MFSIQVLLRDKDMHAPKNVMTIFYFIYKKIYTKKKCYKPPKSNSHREYF